MTTRSPRLKTPIRLSKPLLDLSLYFKQHRPEYYRLLDLVRTEGDWEAWLDFFPEGVEDTASNSVRAAQSLVRLFKEDTRIQTSSAAQNKTGPPLFEGRPVI